MAKVFETLIFENSSGNQVVLSDETISKYWELRGRTGFTAPEVELITQKYINGSTKVINSVLKPRTASVNMVVVGETTSQRDRIFEHMVDILMDADKGEIGKLYVTRSDGKKVYLNCAYSSGLKIKDEYRKFHKFTLTFYAADPYFYAMPSETVIDMSEGEGITLADDLYLGNWALGMFDLLGTGMVINDTGIDLDPVFRIPSIVESLTIRNNSTNRVIEISGLSMQPDDVLVIDTREKYKSIYLEHSDGTKEDASYSLVWSNVDLSMPMVSGGNYLTVTGFGLDRDLIVSISAKYRGA